MNIRRALPFAILFRENIMPRQPRGPHAGAPSYRELIALTRRKMRLDIQTQRIANGDDITVEMISALSRRHQYEQQN